MKKKLPLKIGAGIVGVFLVLCGVLFVHIYQVTHAPKSDARVRQLARIDFKQRIPIAESDKVRTFVAGLDGVEDTYFNSENGILIYTFEVGKQNADAVFKQVNALGNYNATKFTVDASSVAQGCPAIGAEDGWKSRITKFIAEL